MISLSRTYACGGHGATVTEGLTVPVSLGSYCNPSVICFANATSPYTGEAIRRAAKAFSISPVILNREAVKNPVKRTPKPKNMGSYIKTAPGASF